MTRCTLVAGTDEAGYGPNLGPLVVTATLWEVPSDVEPHGMWDSLSGVLTNQPARNEQRLHVADSKQVYSPSSGLLDLETGVLSLLKSIIDVPQTIRGLGKLLAGDPFESGLLLEPWNLQYDPELPIESFPDELSEYCDQLLEAFDESGVRLKSVVSRVIFPHEFNVLVEQADSKGVVLSAATLQLVRAVAPDSEQLVRVYCDKHGGRNRYDGVISDAYEDQFVFRLEESMERSRYRMGRMEFCFRTRAEELLPVALASMVSKYLREVLMIGFNQFWQAQIPDLRPTKGYPLDAKRFLEQISETAAQLQIPPSLFWRSR
ncbi:MAG: hypothetical protein JNL58_13925 [Planctomyces sp.]|nr:hypothetical protein [Planctomyces sp.]